MSVPKGIKLDGRLRRELQDLNKKRDEAIFNAEGEQNVATLVAAVDRRLRAEWDHPEKQADMAVLRKYHYAAPVKGANVRVYEPTTKRYDQTFGVRHLWPDILISGTAFLYAGQKEDERGLYYDCFVGETDTDYADVYAIVEWRRWRQEHMRADAATFAFKIRETTSYARIVEQYPWLDTDEYRPYFATDEFVQRQRDFKALTTKKVA